MRKLLLFVLSMLCINTWAQHQQIEVESQITDVCVFEDGAEIIRKAKNIKIPKGKSTIIFKGISSSLITSSIQYSSSKNIEVLNVSKNKYTDSTAYLAYLEELHQLNQEKSKFDMANLATNKSIEFIDTTSPILNKGDEITAKEAINAIEFYAGKTKEYLAKATQEELRIDKLKREIKQVKRKYDRRNDCGMNEYYSIIIEIESPSNTAASIELKYYVEDQSQWFATYDLEVNGEANKAKLTTKVNVRQSSGIDWENTNIKCSQRKMAQGKRPFLYPQEAITRDISMLDGGFEAVIAKGYYKDIDKIYGKVIDIKADDEPLPFVNIIVFGTNSKGERVQMGGATSDFDGNYSIETNGVGEYLEATFVGYNPVKIPITQPYMEIKMTSGSVVLEEVQIRCIGEPPAEEEIANEIADLKRKLSEERNEKIYRSIKSTLEYTVPLQVSIKSDNLDNTFSVETQEIPANLKYICIPQKEAKAYSVVTIPNWQQYTIPTGMANLIFNDQYKGRTGITSETISDTLEIAMGTDPEILVSRKKIKEIDDKKQIGLKRSKTLQWEIVVENKHNYPINVQLIDQIPVSTLNNVEVEAINISEAKYNKVNGVLNWDLNFLAGEKKVFQVEYIITYPGNKQLYLD